jgi:hypothetical protein
MQAGGCRCRRGRRCRRRTAPAARSQDVAAGVDRVRGAEPLHPDPERRVDRGRRRGRADVRVPRIGADGGEPLRAQPGLDGPRSRRAGSELGRVTGRAQVAMVERVARRADGCGKAFGRGDGRAEPQLDGQPLGARDRADRRRARRERGHAPGQGGLRRSRGGAGCAARPDHRHGHHRGGSGRADELILADMTSPLDRGGTPNTWQPRGAMLVPPADGARPAIRQRCAVCVKRFRDALHVSQLH